MFRQFAYLPPTIAALASLSISALLTTGAAGAAETCLAAPNSTAPQGAHWYYRLERPSQRKCWRLVQTDQAKVAATRAAPEPADAEPAPMPGKGAMQSAPEWITRSASATIAETAAPLQRNPFDRVAELAAAPEPPVSAAPEQAADAPVARARIETPVQQATVADKAVVPAGKTGLMPFVFVAFAGLGLLAAAIVLLAGVRRRRSDVLTRIARADTLARELPADGPTFSPMPPMNLSRHDDIDEALRRSRRRMPHRVVAPARCAARGWHGMAAPG